MPAIRILWLFVVMTCLAPAASRAADVIVYGLGKAEMFIQTNDTPEQVTGQPFVFTALVQPSAPGNVLGAKFRTPNPVTVRDLTNTSSGSFAFSQSFATKAAMDAVFANGSTYTNTMTNLNDGVINAKLALILDLYPSIPTVQGFDGAQQIDPGADYALTWETINPAPGGITMVVQVFIRDTAGNTVIKSPDFGQPGALNQTSTEFLIPANTLQPGTSYTASLVFLELSGINQTDYPGVTGYAGYSRQTDCPLHTTGTLPSASPTTLRVTRATNAVLLSFGTEVGFNYVLQAAPGMTNANDWVAIFSTNATTTNVSYLDTNLNTLPRRFYKVLGQ